MWHWRIRSQNFTDKLLVFSQFLKREHIALVSLVEENAYFVTLDAVQQRGVGNSNLSWLASSMWEYIQAVRRLDTYAERFLARHAVSIPWAGK